MSFAQNAQVINKTPKKWWLVYSIQSDYVLQIIKESKTHNSCKAY